MRARAITTLVGLVGSSLAGTVGCSGARGDQRGLTVAAVYMESHARDVPANLARVEFWARRAAAARADLVLFPEAAISGWWSSRKIRDYAEPIDGPSIRRLIALPTNCTSSSPSPSA